MKSSRAYQWPPISTAPVLFNSAEFLIFFPVVAALFFTLPQRMRWALLLIASCVFYAWSIPAYLLVLLLMIVIDYVAGICIENALAPRRRKLFLTISLASNIGLLAVFKYFDFFNTNASALAAWFGVSSPVPNLGWALPIGLSFHTFQAMSYNLEVYRGHCPAERHPGRYALYVMFFPQLVAGPIERPQNVLPQLQVWQEFDYDRVVSGLRRILFGLFKKVVIADRLAVYVDEVFNHPGAHHGLPVLLAVYFFAFQIYCDFSGYSDIAVGTARVLGVRLMENFRTPYFAPGIREFWQRWHISLSTWFRDYLYIPLGGNRVSAARAAMNLLIVFLVSGLWHGANWTFLIWGGLHGIYLVVELWLRRGERATRAMTLPARIWRIALTFHLTAFAWIFFRAASVGDAFTIIASLWPSEPVRWLIPGVSAAELGLSIAAIATLQVASLLHARHGDLVASLSLGSRWALYVVTVLLLIFLSPFSGKSFIYFQF